MFGTIKKGVLKVLFTVVVITMLADGCGDGKCRTETVCVGGRCNNVLVCEANGK